MTAFHIAPDLSVYANDGRYVGECITDDDGRAVVEFMDPADCVEEATFHVHWRV